MPRIVRITATALADLAAIAKVTTREFGAAQARRYTAHLRWSIENLCEDQMPHGTRRREDLGDDLFTLHTRRTGHASRHVLLWRQPEGSQGSELLRILHDSQDPNLHLPE